MSHLDGGIAGAVKIHDAGPDADRFNIAIFSEGYRYDQLAQFAVDADALVDRLFQTAPFDRFRCHINVYRLDVYSTESGCDDPLIPPDCMGTGAFKATFFGSTFCGYGIERLIWLQSGLVEWVRWHMLPQVHEVIILVNTAKEGGNGDTYATVSKGSGWDWKKVAIHELGHAAFGLGDEYDFLYSCDDDRDSYTGDEPIWPNVAKDIGRATLKWGEFVKSTTPLPTSAHADCSKCHNDPTGYPGGTVGAYEGAGLWHCKLYRPEEECLMRYADDFCTVCSATIEKELGVYAPACPAPTFSAAGSWLLCWWWQLLLVIALIPLSFLRWHPAGACWWRQLMFRLSNCHTGNSVECIDLGGSPPTPIPTARSIPYPYPESDT